MTKEIKGKKYGRLYLESYKKEVVRQVEQEGSIMLICERLGLLKKTVSAWLKKYGSDHYRTHKSPGRSLQERNRIAREIVSGKLSIEEAQLKYQMECRDTVTLWIRQYKRAQQELPELLQQELKAEEPVLEQEVSPEELRLAHLKIRALETMLDIASKEFKTDIRKKFGAKQ